MSARWVVALAAMWIASPAWAVTGLEWKFPAEGHRFHLMTRINLPEWYLFAAEKNTEVRVSQVLLEVVTRCVPAVELKSGWRLDCTLEDVAIQALALPADRGNLEATLAEYDERLTGKVLQVELGRDGRVRNIDLEAYNNRLERTAAIRENLRLIFARAFALVDLQLPKKGDDKGKGLWKQDNLLAVGFPSTRGVLGAVRIAHKIEATEGSTVSIASAGGGILYTGDTVMVQGQERPRNSYNFAYEGKAVFDTAAGAMVSREYLAKGVPTASSTMGENGVGFPYVQAAALDLVTGEAPTLPPTGLLQ
jgi:hypothetical protein